MKSTLQRIQDIKRNGYSLDLGEALNDIFASYKNIALLGGAVLLIVGIAGVVVIGGLAALFVGIGSFTQTMTDYSVMMLSTTGLLANLVISIVAAGLIAPVAAGIIQMAHNSSINEDFGFGTAFMHYKSVYFKELFLAAGIVALVGSGIGTIVQMVNITNPSMLLIFANGLLSALIQIFTLVMIPLIIFGNLKAVDAIKGSIILVSKNFWIILLLAIIIVVFVCLGIIALCIGIIFTLPAMYSLQYIIYKKALPIEETSELDEIGQNF